LSLCFLPSLLESRLSDRSSSFFSLFPQRPGTGCLLCRVASATRTICLISGKRTFPRTNHLLLADQRLSRSAPPPITFRLLTRLRRPFTPAPPLPASQRCIKPHLMKKGIPSQKSLRLIFHLLLGRASHVLLMPSAERPVWSSSGWPVWRF